MFNLDILNYCFQGVPVKQDRSAITTIKQCLIANNIVAPHSMDSPNYFYKITPGGVTGYFITDVDLPVGPIVSPEEYINTFFGYPVDLQWYNQLKVGDEVTIGYCDSNTNCYHFGISVDLVRANQGNVVTIDGIEAVSPIATKWFNGDYRAYHIKELDHYVPSSVFVPQLIPQTPIKSVELTSVSLEIFNL